MFPLAFSSLIYRERLASGPFALKLLTVLPPCHRGGQDGCGPDPGKKASQRLNQGDLEHSILPEIRSGMWKDCNMNEGANEEAVTYVALANCGEL